MYKAIRTSADAILSIYFNPSVPAQLKKDLIYKRWAFGVFDVWTHCNYVSVHPVLTNIYTLGGDVDNGAAYPCR